MPSRSRNFLFSKSSILPPSKLFPTTISPPPDTGRPTKLVESKEEDGLVDLEAEDLRLNERERLAVDLDQALALLAVGDRGRGLLLAEALDALNGRHDGRISTRRWAFVVGEGVS